MSDTPDENPPRVRPSRAAIRLLALLVAFQFVPTAAAHSGTTHAGTPHWLLLAFVVLGLALVVLGGVLVRRDALRLRYGLSSGFAGALLAMFGGIGLVELQVVASTGPQLSEWYPVASVVIGSFVMLGSLVVCQRRWPTRPRYMALGAVLGAWIMYPAVMPNQGLSHPFGYALVLALPALISYVLWVDAKDAVRLIASRRRPRVVGGLTTLLFTVFFFFSAGTLTLNPDTGVNAPTNTVLRTVDIADPLVLWPAVEFVFPSVPVAGFFSVGTVLLVLLVGGLIGLNTALLIEQWERDQQNTSVQGFVGSLSASGATACCCCAPAMYGVISAVFGAAATPVYWAFMDPTSPVGGVFLAASVLLLTASIVRTARIQRRSTCNRPVGTTPA